MIIWDYHIFFSTIFVTVGCIYLVYRIARKKITQGDSALKAVRLFGISCYLIAVLSSIPGFFLIAYVLRLVGLTVYITHISAIILPVGFGVNLVVGMFCHLTGGAKLRELK